MDEAIFYAADVRVSLPQPLPVDTRLSVPMYGFAFTENGLRHDLTAADHAKLSKPAFAPQPAPGDVVWGDVTEDEDREFV